MGDDRGRYIIWARTFHEASEYAAEQDWWLHSWRFEQANTNEVIVFDLYCRGWRDHGWYCNGDHPIHTPDGTHACPTWPSLWRHPIWYVRMHWS